MARTGRPKTDNPRTKQALRLSEEEKKMLEECASKTGMTKTEVIVKGIQLVYQLEVKENKK